MRTARLLLIGLTFGLTPFPVAAATAERELAMFCHSVSNAAVEAGRLRDGGATARAATQTLQSKFSAEETQAGVNAAFAYKQLKEFALFDLSTTYCTRMLGANGSPTDIDRLWVRTHYERAMECSMQGKFEREPYQSCWDAQTMRDKDGIERIILSVMNLELILAEKRACEARFPKYDSQNQQAFSASVLSKISSEAVIDRYAGIGAKQGLLRGLESQRTSAPYLSMEASELEKRCANFPQTPALRSAK